MAEKLSATNLLELATKFMEAAAQRVDDSRIALSLSAPEREDLNMAVDDVTRLDAEMEKLERQANPDRQRLDELNEALACKALRIADAFALAATRILGERDAFVFLPQEARSVEAATAYQQHGAPHLARLCKRSLE